MTLIQPSALRPFLNVDAGPWTGDINVYCCWVLFSGCPCHSSTCLHIAKRPLLLNDYANHVSDWTHSSYNILIWGELLSVPSPLLVLRWCLNRCEVLELNIFFTQVREHQQHLEIIDFLGPWEPNVATPLERRLLATLKSALMRLFHTPAELLGLIRHQNIQYMWSEGINVTLSFLYSSRLCCLSLPSLTPQK